ncbi:SafA/ExsA family spore coat assembly protein [Terribacillus sp. 7520-G]|uniref:SafA/ExsA family spore coat assembly protein n=1 Tax=Terribacillus sp. 7520-G TaxID=2025389 RepID=UPI0018E9E245|nr:SafA/ExsA family spore coat assembly protein [Terribacillus sp. 7520-G]
MKIHIVQKGDTMWSIANKYGVSFDELREMNGHIREPELAVPGMKLKIPTTTKAVEKEEVIRSEAGTGASGNTGQQSPAQTFHDTPAIQEDDMSAAPYPIMPQMPQMSAPDQGGGAYPGMPQQQGYMGGLPQSMTHQPSTGWGQGQQMHGQPSYPQSMNGSWLIPQSPDGSMQNQGGGSMQGDWGQQGGQPGQQMQGGWGQPGGQPGQQMQGYWGQQGGQPGQQMQGGWGQQGGQSGQQMQGGWGQQGGQPGQQMQGDWSQQGGQPGQQIQGYWDQQGQQMQGRHYQAPAVNQPIPYFYPQTPMRSCCGPDIPFPAAPPYQQAQPEYRRDPYGVQPPLSDFYEPSPAQDLPGDEQDNK